MPKPICLTQLLVILLGFGLAGCSSTPPETKASPEPQPATRVNLQIETTKLINPDADGKASPLVLNVYELSEQSGFNGADFFALYEKGQAILGGDLMRKQELVLQPATQTSLQFEIEPKTRFIGFLAAFRKLDTAKWRLVMPITAGRTNFAVLHVKDNQLTLQNIDKGD